MPNALTRHVGFNAGSWVLETLVKHYIEHLFEGDVRKSDPSKTSGVLRRDELLYDEVFHIVKSFMDASTHHTVEELQAFSNARTPSPPWIHVTRVLIPMSCCEAAATYLIEALGGEQKANEVAGGTKWWQVRGLKGIDGQWIVARKDYNKSVRRRVRIEKEKEKASEKPDDNGEESAYNPKMNELKCILYFHGGGYYFGSVDQERYFLQRFARKSSCRLLAINYRLAPQYPFPCAIQDAVASYLYLIRPPPNSLHTAIDPSNIIVGGDSAGGGLAMALLQVIRDSGLPSPAGGVLVSPWCDLTHSFPSIHLNTETDVIPKYGLSVYKPSPLWPAPSEDLTIRVHKSLRSRVKQLAHDYTAGGSKVAADPPAIKTLSSWKRKLSLHKLRARSKSEGVFNDRRPRRHSLAEDAQTGDVRAAAVQRSVTDLPAQNGEPPIDLGGIAPLPTADNTSEQTLLVRTMEGEELRVHDQVHMYAPNNILAHPLVSPAFSYLGGLPPLFVISSDAEVLRDEIIYSAHKAAYPERYPVKPESRRLYPKLEGIESRYGPTKVHLQVYDQTGHVLPVLFSFSTPAKFCFRAMASFTRHAFGTLTNPANDGVKTESRPDPQRSKSASLPRRLSVFKNTRRQRSETEPIQRHPSGGNSSRDPSSSRNTSVDEIGVQGSENSSRSSSIHPVEASGSDGISVRYAGDPAVYFEASDGMIRERVSIKGVIRPLEPEKLLPGCTMPDELIGVVGELALRRYQEGRAKWDEKYAHATRHIQKHRNRNLERANKETVRNVTQLQMHFFQNADNDEKDLKDEKVKGVKEGLRKSSASWAWAWALDGAERPPASSIVARRDTEEARRLSRIADQPVDESDKHMSANNLWSFLINRLSTEKEVRGEESSEGQRGTGSHGSHLRKEKQKSALGQDSGSRRRSFFSTSAVRRPQTAPGSADASGNAKKFWSGSVVGSRTPIKEFATEQANGHPGLSETTSR